MKECPLKGGGCKGTGFELVSTRIREGEGRIVRCNGCHLVMQDIDWTPEEFARYYNEEYQQTNSLVTGELQTPKDHFKDRIQTIRPYFEELKPFLKRSSEVLEVGCGAGELLSLIKPHVKSCTGVEMNQDFVNFMQSDLKIEARTGDITQMDWGTRKFDLIICVDCLDHVQNPVEVLKAMRRLLKPKGAVWATVASLDEALRHYLPEPNRGKYQEFFWHRAHTFYFSPETIASTFKAAGFGLKKINYYHEYTLKNYLKWYFTGQRQMSYVEAAKGVAMLPDKDPFEKSMNALFKKTEAEFQKILRRTRRANILCCYAVPQ